MADNQQIPQNQLDPELIRLFVSALGGNSVSSMLGNLDNPLLPVLAGVYSPPVGSSGGTLYDQYKATESTNPDIINRILYNIENGMNQYEIEADIDAAIGAIGEDFSLGDDVNAFGAQIQPFGMSPETLKSMAKEMQKQYSSNKGKSDYWEKAGLRNPIDVYTLEDVPMGRESTMTIQDIQSALPGIMQRRSKTGKDVKALMRSFSERQKEAVKNLYEEGSFRDTYAEIASGEEIKPEDLIKKRLTPDVYKALQRKAPKEYKYLASKANIDVTDVDRSRLRGIIRQLAQTNKIKSDATMKEMAVRQGALDAYKASGRTPLMDQLAPMMQLLSASSKK